MDRSLLLDVTSPAVTAKGNIFEKAKIFRELHPRSVVIIVSGSLISWVCGSGVSSPKIAEYRRRERVRTNELRGKAKDFETVLDMIDIDFPTTPIAVFGYSQMVRGVSYRSSKRVPSHYVLLFGKAMSLCRLVQAAGRANGNQAQVLIENTGDSTVKILTTPADYDAVRNYPTFIEKIRAAMVGGLNLQQALEMPWDAKFDFSQSRDLGAKRAMLQQLQQKLHFKHQTSADLDEMPGAAFVSTHLPGLMRVILEILNDGFCYDEVRGMPSKDLREEIEKTETYHVTGETTLVWAEYMSTETIEEVKSLDSRALTAKLNSTLAAMNGAKQNEEPLVERTAPGSTVRWYITLQTADKIKAMPQNPRTVETRLRLRLANLQYSLPSEFIEDVDDYMNDVSGGSSSIAQPAAALSTIDEARRTVGEERNRDMDRVMSQGIYRSCGFVRSLSFTRQADSQPGSQPGATAAPAYCLLGSGGSGSAAPAYRSLNSCGSAAPAYRSCGSSPAFIAVGEPKTAAEAEDDDSRWWGALF